MSEQATLKSNYVAYPEYKDSKIEWVGEIPSTWVINPAFVVFTEECLKNVDGREQNVLSLSYGSIKRRDIASNSGLLPESFNTYQIVNNGDIILRLTDLQNDKKSLRVGRSTQKGIITSAYMKLVSQPPLDSRYAYRLLHSYDTTKVFYGLGGGLRQSMKFDDFRRLPILVPSIEEQRTIAAFLDYETARIDSLIDKQQRLIELLKEKRQAVISHAVTKGLNPDAPLKDSGVEWLGQVPEHWRLPKLVQVSSRVGDGLHGTPRYADGTGFFFVNGNNLDNGIIRLGRTAKEVPEEECLRHAVPLGCTSVLMSINGTIGNLALYQGEPIMLGKSAAYINCLPVLKRDYLMYFLSGDDVSHYFDLELTGTTIANLSLNSIRQMKVCVPHVEEQESISLFCRSNFERYGQLISKAMNAVSLMQERRTALISAAVTGKIDLRGWTQPVKEDAA